MIARLLENIQSHITISQSEKEILKTLFKEKTYKKGDYFLSDGQICKYVGFISRGLMRYYINHDGEEKTYAFSQENQFVCNYESFLPQSQSSKIIQALEDSDVLVISHTDLQSLYAKIREGERFGRIAIEAVFLQLLKDINSLYTETPEVRYEQFIQNHPDLQQRISQYHPTGGELLSVAGGKYRILVSGKQTNGAFATIEMSVPPQSGPGSHSHANFFESFYILEGEVEVHSEAGFYTAKKGAFVVVPEGGIIHNFKNVSHQVALLI